MKLKICSLVCGPDGFWGLLQADQSKTDVVERLESATKVLHQIVNAPDKGIPDEVLKGAKCVAVVPGLIKGGFIIAGKHGRGVSTCQLPKGVGVHQPSSLLVAEAGEHRSALNRSTSSCLS